MASSFRHDYRINSAKLDIDLWLNDSETNTIVEVVWNCFTEKYPQYLTPKRGPRPKASAQDHFRVLLLNLYNAWNVDPLRWLSIPMSPKGYLPVNSRYNSLGINRSIIEICNQLIELEWIDFKRGRYDRNDADNSFNSRVRAKESLQLLFRKHPINVKNSKLSLDRRETVILRSGKLEDSELTSTPDLVEYSDTDQTIRTRSILSTYNKLLQRTHIDLATLDDKYLLTTYTTRKRRTVEQLIRIDNGSTFTRRIFSRGSWNKGGRFYGGFWQQISEAKRKDIFIDGEPTIEVDYKAIHVALIYAVRVKEHWPYGADPYDLGFQLSESVSLSVQRKRVKALVLAAINARTRMSAFNAFRYDAPAGSQEKRLKNVELHKILDAFIERHPKLAPYIASDQGIELMRVDGDIVEEVLRLLTDKAIPVLTVHDSFIVQRKHIGDLKAAMSMASIRVAGQDLFSAQEGYEFRRDRPFKAQTRELLNSKLAVTPCEEYLERLRHWQKSS